MVNWMKRGLRAWLFPEYDKVCRFMLEIENARHETLKLTGDVTLEKPTVFVGSLHNCNVHYNPTVKPKIVLTEMAALLNITGEQHSVISSYFSAEPVKEIDPTIG